MLVKVQLCDMKRVIVSFIQDQGFAFLAAAGDAACGRCGSALEYSQSASDMRIDLVAHPMDHCHILA
ncbi:hypothetical protein Mnod_4782 [Methylobacterium nodulans ORS 2060]|uniref:Uncharacterized protein n=2 Tax=Methylobacterium nodulans TaxID=114616 RepID=B8IFT6_METNO|nr:hypothetical protein Mnod_4782 [Methylobacterium nodulans ORS 2060]